MADVTDRPMPMTHLAWEATGGNRWYIEQRDPADFPKGMIA